MAAKVVTVAFEGVEARRVDVEVQFTNNGDPMIIIVGLGDKAVGESRDVSEVSATLDFNRLNERLRCW